jgi:hypothetical protein
MTGGVPSMTAGSSFPSAVMNRSWPDFSVTSLRPSGRKAVAFQFGLGDLVGRGDGEIHSLGECFLLFLPQENDERADLVVGEHAFPRVHAEL